MIQSFARLGACAFGGMILMLPQSASAAGPFPDGQFRARVLALHNRERLYAGVIPLVWDSRLEATAASYARYLQKSHSFQHSQTGARGDAGENLWMGTRGAFSVDAMVGGWAAEKRAFIKGIFPSVSRTGNWADVGHYAQMVWPTTMRLGCATASNSSFEYLVCDYAPAGNVFGYRVPR